MSDREFASLQARRNAPFTSKTEKTKLTRQINAEIARRKVRQNATSGGSGGPKSHPKLYHVTRSRRQIEKEGFHGKARSSDEGGAGAYFGSGTYFHTDKSQSDQYLQGTRAYGYGDEEQVEASAHVEKPFEVRVQAHEQNELEPSRIMHRALQEAGIVRPGERLKPSEITERLKQRGYDAVWVRQPQFSHEVAGDQLVVFDAAKASFGHEKAVGTAARTRRPKSRQP